VRIRIPNLISQIKEPDPKKSKFFICWVGVAELLALPVVPVGRKLKQKRLHLWCTHSIILIMEKDFGGRIQMVDPHVC
jgi:hypothetical protein